MGYCEDFLEKVRSCGGYDMPRIEKALAFADKAHEGQMRKSGEPYITHPIAVAEILLEYDCDTDSVIAALFHDIVEDTDIPLETIRKGFGADVALLVDGVTKLGSIMYSSKEEQQVETLRKMLLAMTKDIRVILIKLADRLHNVRTLDSLPEEKRRQKALESIEVYAPLAHRLGIQNMKTEIEDLSLRALDPIGYKEVEDDLAKFNLDNDLFEDIKQQIVNKMKEEGLECTVDGRVKHIYSIYRKMFTQNKQFNEIYDLYAFRIIVDKVAECYNVLGYIHDMFRAIPGRLKDYIATPKPNRYQSLHTTVSYKGYLFEVQIRTAEMHRTAEMGIAAHWKYKGGVFNDNSLDSKLEWVRALLEAQKDVNDTDDFMKTFKIDLFADQVFVATPKGDIINLPADANPIDFAYAIHTAVGNKMVGAKVNGRIAEITTPLQNGDVVEILTSSSSGGPSRDWLKLATTSQAKNKIRQWFKKEKREENIIQGREDLERELKRINVNLSVIPRETLYAQIMKRYSFENMDEFYAAIGYGGISISKILPKLKEEYTRLVKQSEPAVIPETASKKNKAINGVIVENIDNCLVKLAGCCSPLPGDPIVGFVTRGYGVSVHKEDCKNVKNIPYERMIGVRWASVGNDYFPATVCINASGRIDLIADITTLLASMRIQISAIKTHELGDGRVQIFITIEVHEVEHLDYICRRLGKLQGVTDITRSKVNG